MVRGSTLRMGRIPGFPEGRFRALGLGGYASRQESRGNRRLGPAVGCVGLVPLLGLALRNAGLSSVAEWTRSGSWKFENGNWKIETGNWGTKFEFGIPFSTFYSPFSTFQFPVSTFHFPVSGFHFPFSIFYFPVSDFDTHPSPCRRSSSRAACTC